MVCVDVPVGPGRMEGHTSPGGAPSMKAETAERLFEAMVDPQEVFEMVVMPRGQNPEAG